MNSLSKRNRVRKVILGCLLSAAVAVSAVLLGSSCASGYTSAGCNANYRAGITSTTTMKASDTSQDLTLTGTVAVYAGTLTVQVFDPDMTLVWSAHYLTGNTRTIDERFTAKAGTWLLYVESGDDYGVGDVDIRLTQD